MKIFTVRELDRQPAAVLDAADREGIARIRRRDGRIYTISPETASKKIAALPDFRARINKNFPQTVSKSHARLFDKLLAGE